VTCPPTPGLDSSYYSIDFTQVTSQPSDWTVPTWCNVTYNTKGRRNGAELEFLQEYDSPQLYSNFYFLFGRAEFVVQAAPGPGIISDMMLLSDDLDELDWEFRGTLDWEVQTGWFGKGVTGLYNHSITPNVPTPMKEFHTYAYDWTPERVNWEADGVIVRTLQASDCLGTNNQYPQTPMKLMAGLWDAGDPNHYNPWSAGMTPIPPPAGGYSFYVKSVTVWNRYPAACYNWTDHSGDWQSIQVINDTASCGVSSTPSSALPITTSTSSSLASSSSTESLSSTFGSLTPASNGFSSSASSSTASQPSRSSTTVDPALITSSLGDSSPNFPSSFGSVASESSSSASSVGALLISDSESEASTSNQILTSQSLAHTATSSSALSSSATSQSLTTELSTKNIVAVASSSSAPPSSGSLSPIISSSISQKATTSSLASLMASTFSSSLIETPADPATSTAMGSFNTIPNGEASTSLPTTAISTSPHMPATDLSQTVPTVFPGHHTLSDSPSIDHVTEILGAVNSLIDGEWLRGGESTSLPSESTSQSSPAASIQSISAVVPSSALPLASSLGSPTANFGTTKNNSELTVSSACPTTTDPAGSSVAALTVTSSFTPSIQTIQGEMSSLQPADTGSLSASSTASNGTASFNVSALVTSHEQEPRNTTVRTTVTPTLTATSTHSYNSPFGMIGIGNHNASTNSTHALSAPSSNTFGISQSSTETDGPNKPSSNLSSLGAVNSTLKTPSHSVNAHLHHHAHHHHGHEHPGGGAGGLGLTSDGGEDPTSGATSSATSSAAGDAAARTTTPPSDRSSSFENATSTADSSSGSHLDKHTGIRASNATSANDSLSSAATSNSCKLRSPFKSIAGILSLMRVRIWMDPSLVTIDPIYRP